MLLGFLFFPLTNNDCQGIYCFFNLPLSIKLSWNYNLLLNRYSDRCLRSSGKWVGFPFVSVYNCWFCSKFYYFYFVASILPLYFKIYPGLHYRARHLLIRDQKTPPPILYIKASTVDDEYCPTQLFHQVISSTDEKQSGIFY